IACQEALVAYLPVDSPTERCAAADLAAAAAPAGVVVRNDGSSPCVLGELSAIEGAAGPLPSFDDLPAEPARNDSPEGPPVTALAPGDVVWFETMSDPLADCSPGTAPHRLTFTALDDPVLDVELPSGCLYARLGGGRAYFGASRGPLVDAPTSGDLEAAEAWLAELAPFVDSG
ncbi:MAG: hypothetical protein ACRDZZ_03075, partial [Ilumatobacteraceae bacterium]